MLSVYRGSHGLMVWAIGLPVPNPGQAEVCLGKAPNPTVKLRVLVHWFVVHRLHVTCWAGFPHVSCIHMLSKNKQDYVSQM